MPSRFLGTWLHIESSFIVRMKIFMGDPGAFGARIAHKYSRVH